MSKNFIFELKSRFWPKLLRVKMEDKKLDLEIDELTPISGKIEGQKIHVNLILKKKKKT